MSSNATLVLPAHRLSFSSASPVFGSLIFNARALGAESLREMLEWSVYRVHNTTGDDLGLLDHPAPNLEPGDVVLLADGREALVTARVDGRPGPFEALREVVSYSGGSLFR